MFLFRAVLIAFLMTASFAQAQKESKVRHLSKKSWALEEMFGVGEGASGKRFFLQDDLKAFIEKRVKELLDRNDLKGSGRYWDEVFSNIADFRLVSELPCSNSINAPIACTREGTTYLKSDLYFKLDSAHQLLVLLSERAQALDERTENKNWIQPFRDGLEVVLRLIEEQDRHQYRLLSSKERGLLFKLFTLNSIRTELEAEPYQPKKQVISILERGGGVYFSSPALVNHLVVDDTSWIGIGSRINFDAETCTGKKGSGNLFILKSHVLESRLDCVSTRSAFIMRSQIIRSDPNHYNKGAMLDRASTVEGSIIASEVKIEMPAPIDIENHSHLSRGNFTTCSDLVPWVSISNVFSDQSDYCFFRILHFGDTTELQNEIRIKKLQEL